MVLFEVLSREKAFKILTSSEKFSHDDLKFAHACFLYGRNKVMGYHERDMMWQKTDNFLCTVFEDWHDLREDSAETPGYMFLALAWMNACIYKDVQGKSFVRRAIESDYAVSVDYPQKTVEWLYEYVSELTPQERLSYEFYLASAYLYGWGAEPDKEKALVYIKSALNTVYETEEMLTWEYSRIRAYQEACDDLFYEIRR